MACRLILLLLAASCISGNMAAQDSAVHPLIRVEDRFVHRIDRKISGLDDQLTRQSEKYLRGLFKQEEKIRKSLARLDSAKAAAVFTGSKKNYERLSQKLAEVSGSMDKAFSGEYLPGLDSLQAALGFLKDAKHVISKSKHIREQLSQSLEQVKQLQNKLQQAAEIKQYVQQRQQQLKELLSGYTALPKDITKHLGKYQQNVYSYSRQVQEYKEALNDPDRLMKKVLAVLQTVPSFKKFMQQHSMLVQWFPVPEQYNPGQMVPGLAAREQIVLLLQDQSGAGARGLIQQSINSAQGQADELRSRLSRLGIHNSGDLTMPDFTPNGLQTVPFLKRLEYGLQLQSQRATDYFPSCTDIIITVGYKPDKKTVFGIGVSGKMGWGKSWNEIRVTTQGVGFRVYADWKVPPLWNGKNETLWLTGGGEMNYTRPVESLAVFKNYSGWNKSALIGVSKKFSVSKKLKGNISLLYDFLYQQSIPVSKPFLFRIGYHL